ncbi:DDE-type integrase/transposase/recombinase [Lichenicola cladoniae]|uniref:DDE-type integrase/transposase/recombinase n=1 Tax=Lichenicola cladoniae TaxID=1484109 RepID=UPI0019538481
MLHPPPHRTSKFAVVHLAGSADRQSALALLETVIKAVPYRIHTVLADSDIPFCHPPRYRSGPIVRFGMHLFDRLCRQPDVENRLTKPNHPWTNGQVERMNRTIKDATVER